MFELFRFIALRPAQKADESQTVAIAIPKSQFQIELALARAGELRTVMNDIAKSYLAGAFSPDTFVNDVSALAFHQQLSMLDTQIKQTGNLNLSALRQLITDIFKVKADALVADKDFLSDKERVFDSIIAIMITSNGQPSLVNDLIRFARLLALIERVAAGDATLDQAGAVLEALQRTILLPAALFPLPSPLESTPNTSQNGQHATQVTAANTELTSRATTIKSAIESLLAMDVSDFAAPSVTTTTSPSSPAPSTTASAPLFERSASQPIESRKVNQSAVIHQPSVGFFTLRAESLERLDPAVKGVLTNLKIDLSSTPLPVALNRLQHELSNTMSMMNELQSSLKGQQIVKIDSKFEGLPSTLPAVVSERQPMAPPNLPLDLPTSHGTIKPVGIADLLVVKQQLKRYEAGEISYIENILKGEMRKHETKRTRTTEQTFLTETETTKEEERDLQATERFELKRETDTTIKEDTSVKAGVAVSASYGGMLEVKSNLDVATDNAKEEATKQATNYSKDVTTRAASKVTERIRQQQTLKIVEQFEETNEHGIDNTNGSGHIIGIYQWIDKIYEAQVFNYGKRLLFDVMVPEPAAFLIDALSVHQTEGQALVKPDPFTLTPDQLDESNYLGFVQKYGVTGVEPPPPLVQFVSWKADGQNQDGSDLIKSDEIPLPPDYVYWGGNADIEFLHQLVGVPGANAGLALVVGADEIIQMSPPPFTGTGAHGLHSIGETDKLPVTITTHGTYAYTIAIELICQRIDERALTKWKIKTHEAIMQAYLKMQSDYEDKLAALAVQQQGVQFPGRDPDENRKLERLELKKACISLLTDTHVDFFDAVEPHDPSAPPKSYPQIDLSLAEAQGNYIRFFEQAFEWDQMMYFFYPYFWGRKRNWYERVLLEDADPLFAEFLKAGAARVVFPVRPAFEQVIMNFLEGVGLDTILKFGEQPITSKLYVSIVDEIKESQKAPGKETAQGDPWDVRLPTTLVKLRADASLPKWKKDPKDPSGEWIPDE